MKQPNGEELLEKYNAGNCTEEEKALVEKWYLDFSVREFDCTQEYVNRMGEEIWAALPVNQPVRSFRWVTSIAAAIFLAVFAFGSYFYLNRKPTGPKSDSSTADIPPGGHNAILTLGNGKKIDLTQVENGQLATQSGIRIAKTTEGQLVYTFTGQNTPENKTPEMNTIETPRGGDYQINLPDGTKVWLNAASSLRFATAFSNGERRVELRGEAYFEVAPNKSLPFRVATSGQLVEVTGTHFNINSYNDEPAVKTTLLEGSVKVTSLKNHQSKNLIPGQQAIVSSGDIDVVSNTDVTTAIAWKNDEFIFKNDDFRTEMRKIARWYDVEIVYDDSAPDNFELGGFISRKKDISAVFKLIELTGKVHFKIQGRRILVTR